MSDKRPYYDPKIAHQQSILRAVEDAIKALPKGVLELGRAVILPNREAGFAQGIVIKKKP